MDPCQIAARLGEAGDETQLDRIFVDEEDDGNRRGCGLGCQRRHRASGRSDHGDLLADQFGRQRRGSIS